MKRLQLLNGFVLLLFVCLLSMQALASESKRPNIVLILADDLGYGDVGCYNPESKIPTPNIDRLAREGIRFTDAHSTSAVCTPTRYSVLTGRYCWRTHLKQGVITSFDPLLIEPGRVTIASMLKEQGYATVCIGKWHLGFGTQSPIDYSQALKPGPLEVGFDYFFGIPSSLHSWPRCYVRNHHVVGELKGPKVNQWYGKLGQATEDWDTTQCGLVLTQEAVDAIGRHARSQSNQPLFLFYSSQAPHRPCWPPALVRGKSQAGPRGDMCFEVDWTVGEIRKALARHGLLDNTLIIFASDNGAIPGTQQGSANQSRSWKLYGHKSCGLWRGYKTQIWEGGHRVPFIARWPGRINPNTQNHQTMSLVDLLATCAGIVGYSLPTNAGEDSYNLLPALLGQVRGRSLREATICHGMLGMYAIMQGPWKLIDGLGGDGEKDREHIGVQAKPVEGHPEGQLYHLLDDPAEQVNLWNRHPEVVERLRALLDRYKQQGRSTPVGNTTF